ncbi:MAG TPA: hypothetical protein VMW15_03205 [Terracidiphilus sp.]|nr:hypothetical protein [Terracidiphilus sp.]
MDIPELKQRLQQAATRQQKMIKHSQSSAYSSTVPPEVEPSEWLKVGVVAAASALAGGLAAAWWYRKTLKALRQTGEETSDPQFGIPTDYPSDEV